MPAQRLTVADVQRFRSEVVKTGKIRTAQVALLRLKQALAWAVSSDLLPRNVAAGVKRPSAKAPERKTWSGDQARRFLAAAETDGYSPLWLVLISTGLRRGEALGWRWQDIDFDRGWLTVRQCVVAGHGAPLVQEPKSKAARRTVRLPSETVAALKTHRKRQAERQLSAAQWADTGLVFCTGAGKPINPRHVLRSFAAIVKRAAVPRISIHDLRHTHATLLLRDGVPLKVVSERWATLKRALPWTSTRTSWTTCKSKPWTASGRHCSRNPIFVDIWWTRTLPGPGVTPGPDEFPHGCEFFLVRPAGLEPATSCSGGKRSIR